MWGLEMQAKFLYEGTDGSWRLEWISIMPIGNTGICYLESHISVLMAIREMTPFGRQVSQVLGECCFCQTEIIL